MSEIETGLREHEVLCRLYRFLGDMFFRWTEISACRLWEVLKERDSSSMPGRSADEHEDLLAFAEMFVPDPDHLEWVIRGKQKYEQPPFPMRECWLHGILDVLHVTSDTDTLEGIASLRGLGRELMLYLRQQFDVSTWEFRLDHCPVPPLEGEQQGDCQQGETL